MKGFMDLAGRRGLVLGIANEHSIAYGCARAFVDAGAELAVTWLDERARPWVEPLASTLGASLSMPCDVAVPGQLDAVFDRIEKEWGRLDFLLHAIAFAPREDLHGSIVDSSAAGFGQAMDISCHSFIRCARLARPLMKAAGGGSLITVSYHGADRVVEHYNLMGPVKAALESTVRALAVDLAAENIRAHALSTGPVATRAASGIEHFDELIEAVRARTPGHRLVGLEQIGHVAAFLASESGAPLSGSVTYADAGFHITA